MKVLVPLIDGFEEIEAISVIDVLRRAGLEVVTAGIPGTMVTGVNGVKVIADTMIKDMEGDDFQAIVLPGGPGCKDLIRSGKVMDMLKGFKQNKKLIAAICYSPVVLAREGFLDGVRATVYPGNERELSKPRSDRVVADENIITSQGPGTAIEFALKIVEVMSGKQKADTVRKALVA